MPWKRLVLVFALGVPLLAVLAYGFTRDPREIPSPLIGRPAPPFTVRLMDGREAALADFRGQVVFLNFWASWCPPCRAEARLLEASWLRHREQDIVFLGVNMQDREDAAREFVREFGITYANGIDGGNRIAIGYGVWGIPETFIIDRTGRITYKHIGALGAETIHAKLEDARRGTVSQREGKGEYRSIQ
ncbi:MAG: TlpA family protein disulfide reductase [Candidatus Rokubacteria bacterium]|nr:TlpA family protein disulfide reductase [Candidatus Rokubacteria bacterium]